MNDEKGMAVSVRVSAIVAFAEKTLAGRGFFLPDAFGIGVRCGVSRAPAVSRDRSPARRTLGPRDERSVRATDFAAWMFAFCASMPRIRLLLPCSCRREERGRRGERKRGDAGDREAVGTLARSRRGVVFAQIWGAPRPDVHEP